MEQADAAAARDDAERYRLLFESSLDAILITRPDGTIEATNPAACEMFGLSAADICRLGRAGLFEEDVPAMRAMVAGRRATGQWRGELVALRGGRVRFPVEVSTRLFRTADGREGSALFIRDLTERKRSAIANELLAETGRLLHVDFTEASVLSALPQLVVPRWADACLVDGLEDVVDDLPRPTDPLAVALLDLRATRGFDLGLSGVLSGAPPVFFSRFAPEAADPPPWCDGEARAIAALGIGSCIVMPLMSRGRPTGAVTFVRLDATPPFEAADVPIASAFADRVALALDNVRLFASQRAATRLRDDVLAIVSHDLRNPLNAISLDAQAMLRRAGRPADRASLERILRSVHRAERLIRDLVDVSGLESGELALDWSPVDLAGLVREVLELARPIADDRELTIEEQVAPDLPLATLDRDRIRQVLENLVSNALKFTPPGGRVCVGAGCDGPMLHLWVTDTGPGIAPDDLPHLFEKFWRADRSPTGIGLGLQIVHSIVQAHQGTIAVDSALGRGTTMHVRLPSQGSPAP